MFTIFSFSLWLFVTIGIDRKRLWTAELTRPGHFLNHFHFIARIGFYRLGQNLCKCYKCFKSFTSLTINSISIIFRHSNQFINIFYCFIFVDYTWSMTLLSFLWLVVIRTVSLRVSFLSFLWFSTFLPSAVVSNDRVSSVVLRTTKCWTTSPLKSSSSKLKKKLTFKSF